MNCRYLTGWLSTGACAVRIDVNNTMTVPQYCDARKRKFLSLYHWPTVPLAHCTTGPLAHCTTGPLYHWPPVPSMLVNIWFRIPKMKLYYIQIASSSSINSEILDASITIIQPISLNSTDCHIAGINYRPTPPTQGTVTLHGINYTDQHPTLTTVTSLEIYHRPLVKAT